MTTEDIIEWVDIAISTREESYFKNEDGIGFYTMSEIEALEATKPKEAKEYDFSIACLVIPYGNDVTDWIAQINFNKPTDADEEKLAKEWLESKGLVWADAEAAARQVARLVVEEFIIKP